MAKKTQPQFTATEVTIIHAAAHHVWQMIAYDIFAENGGKDISRSEVLELVCDAGRLEDELRRQHPKIAKRVGNMDIDIYRVVRPAFPHARYGL